jgi:hypothetical protein
MLFSRELAPLLLLQRKALGWHGYFSLFVGDLHTHASARLGYGLAARQRLSFVALISFTCGF